VLLKFKIKSMSIIIKIHARQIFDSRGNPTIEVDVVTEHGVLVERQFHLELQLENMKQWIGGKARKSFKCSEKC
jgi:hypothetical protein